jgi:thioredoxin reductase (NADPH)
MTEEVHKVCIIGSGPAGYTAAIYTARAMLKPVLVSGYYKGGQLMNTTDIENYPGLDGVSGPDMMQLLENQATKFGTTILQTEVDHINCSSKPFEIFLSNGNKILASSIIVATGAQALWLNLDGEKQLRSRGVSTCAVCDGAFFKGEKVIVIGGGDTAMADATYLTKYSDDVTIIHRRDEFRASKIMLERAKSNSSIKWKTNCYVSKWISTDNGDLAGAVLTYTDGSTEQVECTGAFIAIGHKPTTDFLNGQVATDEEGFILHCDNTMTSVPGIFACGDVCSDNKRYKQAITASGDGCKAAMDVESWLESISDN